MNKVFLSPLLLALIFAFTSSANAKTPRKIVMEFYKDSSKFPGQKMTVTLDKLNMADFPFGDPDEFDCLKERHQNNVGGSFQYSRNTKYMGPDANLTVDNKKYHVTWYHSTGMGGQIRSRYWYAQTFFWNDFEECIKGKFPDRIVISFNDRPNYSSAMDYQLAWTTYSDEAFFLNYDFYAIAKGTVVEWWP